MAILLTLRGEDAVAPWVAAAQWWDHSPFVLHNTEVGTGWEGELEPSWPFPFPHKSGALLGIRLRRAPVMRNHLDMSGFLQDSGRLCAGEKALPSSKVFTTSLCYWNVNWREWFRLPLRRVSISQIYSGVNPWASEEEDAIFCCYILAAFSP